ncbi:MAG: hypothetical protein M1839_004206 [Geoglossum umbratile]|nr:MAG: hypothetical protein M1839_004206 [Geoglossum umbratile]
MVQILKMTYRLRSLEDEMHAYKNAFDMTSNLVTHVDSTRTKFSALCTAEARARIDRELQRARTALEDAKGVMGWKDGARSGVLGTVDAVEWALKYKDAAKAHNLLLRQCHNTLTGICVELTLVSEGRTRPSEVYFQEIQTRMLSALSRRVMKNAAIYSGAGEQAPRPRLFEPEQSAYSFLLFDVYHCTAEPVILEECEFKARAPPVLGFQHLSTPDPRPQDQPGRCLSQPYIQLT